MLNIQLFNCLTAFVKESNLELRVLPSPIG